jgi:protein TonB
MEPVEGAFGGEPPAENSGVVGAAAFAGMAVPVALSGRPPMSEAEYTALVMKRLEEKKVYPLAMRKRGIEGDAAVRFTIRPDGSLGSIRAGDAPAHPFLAQAALETVRAAAPFPVMEGHGGDYALNVTIRFQLE